MEKNLSNSTLPQHDAKLPVSPRIDWVELRKNFFNECTTETPKEESGKKVNIAPHDLFEWFKREISEYVG